MANSRLGILQLDKNSKIVIPKESKIFCRLKLKATDLLFLLCMTLLNG
jgi:hypothetical protein